MPQRPVTGRPFEPCLETADVDTLVDRLRVAGVPYTCAPVPAPAGLSRRYVGT
jgi:hypothetical protein